MRKIKCVTLALVCLFFVATRASDAQGSFYVEEKKDGRIYVFNDVKIYDAWKKSGKMGKSITRIGAGPDGETIVFDSEQAIHLYNFKHDLPPEVILNEEPAAPKVQEKVPYKFSGYMFGDYFYNAQRDAGVANFSNVALPGDEDFNGFVFRRIYFTFDDDVSDDFAARLRLEADSVSLDSHGKITVFVKDAYLRWKNAFGRNDIIFGIQPTPAYEISEAAWAYRSLEKTIMDLRGIVSSRDVAVSLKGKLDEQGKYNYWVMAGNGSGNNPETDKFKRGYFHFQWKPNETFQLTAYQDIRALPDIPDPNDATRNIENTSYTTAFYAGYGTIDKFNLGYETFFTFQQNGTKIGSESPFVVDDTTAIGHSVWAWYNFSPRFGLVGRYDYLEPNKNNDVQGDKRNLVIGSAVIKPHKNIWIMPNVNWESYEDKAGTSFDSSVVPRLTFYYIFL